MNEPLAERIRPKVLEDYISQQHLVGKDGILTNLVKRMSKSLTAISISKTEDLIKLKEIL